jgi:hypothetical protein
LFDFSRVVCPKKKVFYLLFLYAAWDGQTVVYLMNLLTTTTMMIIIQIHSYFNSHMPITKVAQNNYDINYTNTHKQHNQTPPPTTTTTATTTITTMKLNSVAKVRERTIPSERPPPVGEVSVTWSAQRIPTAVNLCFLDRSRYFFIQVAPQLTSRG